MAKINYILSEKKEELEGIMRKGCIEYFEFLKECGRINHYFNIELVATITSSQRYSDGEISLFINDKKKYEKHIEDKRKNVLKMIKRTFGVSQDVEKISCETLLNEFDKRYDTALLGIVNVYEVLKIDIRKIRTSDVFVMSSLMYLVDSVIDGKNIEFNIFKYMNNQDNADMINAVMKKKEDEINEQHK